MQTKIGIWLKAVRLKTLSAILVPIAFGTAHSLQFVTIHKIKLYAILCFGLSIQILTNLVNDRCDFLKGADNEARIGPMRAMQSKLISLNEINISIFIFTALALLSGFYLYTVGGTFVAYLVVSSILCAYLYTAGPFALSYLGLGDIFVLLFFGPIATGATEYLLSGQHSFESYLIGIIPGLLSTAILVANNIRDYANDMQARKKTLIVRFGRRFGQVEYFSLLILAAILHLYFFRKYNAFENYIPPALIIIFTSFVILKKLATKEEHIKKLLPLTSGILTLYGITSLIFWY